MSINMNICSNCDKEIPQDEIDNGQMTVCDDCGKKFCMYCAERETFECDNCGVTICTWCNASCDIHEETVICPTCECPTCADADQEEEDYE